jgi:hypothetical protein
MDTMPLVTLILLAIPEGMLLALIGLTLIGIRPYFRTILYVSILFTISAFFARKLNLPLGTHSLIIYILLSIYLFYLCGISYKKSIGAAFLGFIFLVAAESLFLPLIMASYSITGQMIMDNSWLRILVSIPQQLFLLAVFVISYRLRGFHKQTGSTEIRK